jgi:hypothetical protein
MNKVATAEELQAELRSIWAMTEEPSPSRAKIAEALGILSEKIASSFLEVHDALNEKDGVGLKKALDNLKGSFAVKYLIEAMEETSTTLREVRKLLGIK